MNNDAPLSDIYQESGLNPRVCWYCFNRSRFKVPTTDENHYVVMVCATHKNLSEPAGRLKSTGMQLLRPLGMLIYGVIVIWMAIFLFFGWVLIVAAVDDLPSIDVLDIVLMVGGILSLGFIYLGAKAAHNTIWKPLAKNWHVQQKHQLRK